MKEKVAIACDHGGYALKEEIKKRFAERFDFLDLGTNSTDSVDYPEYGRAVAKAIIGGKASKGILICGTGIGISIAANRFSEIRAANCTNSTMARLTRLHNDSNILALGARLIGLEVAFDIVDVFMSTPFEGGRHDGRVKKLSEKI